MTTTCLRVGRRRSRLDGKGVVFLLAVLIAACGSAGEALTDGSASVGTSVRSEESSTTSMAERAASDSDAPQELDSPLENRPEFEPARGDLPLSFSAWLGGGDYPSDDVACELDYDGALSTFGAEYVLEGGFLLDPSIGFTTQSSIPMGGVWQPFCIVMPFSASNFSLVVERPDGSFVERPIVFSSSSGEPLAGVRDLFLGEEPVVMSATVMGATQDAGVLVLGTVLYPKPDLGKGSYQFWFVADGVTYFGLDIELVHRESPSIEVVSDVGPYRPGEKVRVLLSGFGAAESIVLALYEGTGVKVQDGNEEVFDWYGHLGDFSVNSDGWGIVEVVLPKDLIGSNLFCITNPALVLPDCSSNRFTQLVFVDEL